MMNSKLNDTRAGKSSCSLLSAKEEMRERMMHDDGVHSVFIPAETDYEYIHL